MKKVEKTYGKVAKGVMFAVNPIKKVAVKTTCIVHKFINLQAIQILNNDGYTITSEFYRKYVRNLNEGVSWADQDFKSTNHFFHYSKEKGLYGFSNALDECIKYHNKAISYIEKGDFEKAMFYLGAACHLIQDSTVPQHVNNKLLKSHRSYELWIISKLFNDYDFAVEKGAIIYKRIDDYIRANAKVAYSVYETYIGIKDKDKRYYNISIRTLKQAQRTTAGYLAWFYDEFIKNSLY
ncbi:zinc dependent phospholipase C family protein [Clostridium fallax]|uniref:Phospholipase C n=1 Tax=Clostridium fallax TaxID=1533 RepID=A0A1M4U4P9_9CLOT|nr:zinc dependent phospholipase C family protein [Clostridium fallax]SHE51614.1 phospholipase C [Clostridium fallax]SQB06075.1 zinc dependent phospholipase C [Clostridium fallax]